MSRQLPAGKRCSALISLHSCAICLRVVKVIADFTGGVSDARTLRVLPFPPVLQPPSHSPPHRYLSFLLLSSARRSAVCEAIDLAAVAVTCCLPAAVRQVALARVASAAQSSGRCVASLRSSTVGEGREKIEREGEKGVLVHGGRPAGVRADLPHFVSWAPGEVRVRGRRAVPYSFWSGRVASRVAATHPDQEDLCRITRSPRQTARRRTQLPCGRR
uniref:Uncharacterized protein n=1 Tax=Plectus sambesii TaxID=2011161 RepID=A0A914V5E6_9BILA